MPPKKRVRFVNPVQAVPNPVQAVPNPVQAVQDPVQAVPNPDELANLILLATAGALELQKNLFLSRSTLQRSYTIRNTYSVGSNADAFSTKRQHVEPPVITVPAPQKKSNFEVLCALVAQLPPFKTLNFIKMDDGSIIMQVIAKMLDGRSVDAVITIKNGNFSECLVETKPEQIKLSVPWVPTTQNPKLGAQLLMIAHDAMTVDVTIKPATSGDGYIGIHRYHGVGGIVCFTSASVMEKISFQPTLHPSLDVPNPTLAIIKTPNSPFEGFLKPIKEVAGGFEIDGRVIPSGEVLLLDKAISAF